MFQKIITRILERRHFWRYASFSEVAELYASRLLRVFALKFVSVFTSIYMLKIGYSVTFICLFWATFYGVKILAAYPSAKIIARHGPKHGTLYSNLGAALSMVFLPFVPEYGILALIPWCLIQGTANSLNDFSYLVNFSKVKNAENAGREIGFMNIVEKVAAGISPLIGGVVAAVYNPEAAMAISAFFFALAAWPLFYTVEPTKLRQTLDFRGLPWRTTWRSFVAQSAVGFDVFATATAWTLFMFVVVFSHDGNEIYAKLGALSALTALVVIAASYVFGRLIDRKEGLLLLRTMTLLNSLTHFWRPFIGSVPGIVGNNAINDVATTGHSMAFVRGVFDTADISGHRIVYLFMINVSNGLGALLGALGAALFSYLMGAESGLKVFFVVTAVYTLLIATPRFALYKK